MSAAALTADSSNFAAPAEQRRHETVLKASFECMEKKGVDLGIAGEILFDEIGRFIPIDVASVRLSHTAHALSLLPRLNFPVSVQPLELLVGIVVLDDKTDEFLLGYPEGENSLVDRHQEVVR